jgi:DNA-binding response OmpR family regulator
MLQRGSILIVDSEPAIADLLVDILSDAGYAALTASDSPSAFWQIINYAPALIFLDMHLLDITCFELITHLQTAGAATPIVLMSTVPDTAKREAPGVYRFLEKPFDIDEVLACAAAHVLPIDVGAASDRWGATGGGAALKRQ